MDNDPKFEKEARDVAARFNQKPMRWRPEPAGPGLIVLFEDGRKVHSKDLPARVGRTPPQPKAPRTKKGDATGTDSPDA